MLGTLLSEERTPCHKCSIEHKQFHAHLTKASFSQKVHHKSLSYATPLSFTLKNLYCLMLSWDIETPNSDCTDFEIFLRESPLSIWELTENIIPLSPLCSSFT